MKSAIPFPKGILFDMDGVLLLETQPAAQSWQQVCQQCAPVLNLSPQRLEEALRMSYNQHKKAHEHDVQQQRRDRLEPFETRRETVEQALSSLGRPDFALATEMVRAFESIREERRLTPSALETLQHLRDLGLPLALISNGNATYQRRKIERYHLAPFFQAILIEQAFGVAKPDPQIFLAALRQLGIDPQDAWMVGDDVHADIAGAQQLHIFAIWCDTAKQGLPQKSAIQPDQTISALPELLEFLHKRSNFPVSCL